MHDSLNSIKNALKDHLNLKHDSELLDIHETGILPTQIRNPELRNSILAGIGLVATAIGTGLIILGAGIPATPLVANLGTGLLEESAILGPSLSGWMSNAARIVG